ncbi:STAS domain-containing protein [Pseudonocardia ailaonensis]|uniref:Anti-sigma factor antagonist n=1 Tax=Pseudonocardia ailaonensis TaxID=367279 RepID=A0ABN2NFG5_9PSEU
MSCTDTDDSGSLTTQVEHHPHAVVVRVAGEIDHATVGRLTAATDAAGPGTLLVLDLTAVRFLGSVGLAALITVRDRMRAGGTDVRLVAGDNRTVLRPLELTGLLPEFTVTRELGQALP